MYPSRVNVMYGTGRKLCPAILWQMDLFYGLYGLHLVVCIGQAHHPAHPDTLYSSYSLNAAGIASRHGTLARIETLERGKREG
jgi:hypothetical protein